MNLPNLNSPPPNLPPPPDPGAIAAAVIDLGKGLLEAGGNAVGELAKNAKQVNEHTTEAIQAVGDGMKTTADRAHSLVNSLFQDLMTKANEFYRHLPVAPVPPLPPPLDPTDVLTAIAVAISKAEVVLNAGVADGQTRPHGLMVASCTVDVEFTLKTPNGGAGAATRIHFDIAAKP